MVWNGNRDLIPLLEPIADLVEDAENAKIHPEHNLAAIRESLGMLSQYRPLTGWRPAEGAKIVILAGNGTLQSMRAIGWTHAAVTVFEGKPHAARTLAIIDNKTAELSTWNEELVARQIEECSAVWAAEEVAPVVEETATAEPERAPAAEPARPERVSHEQSKPVLAAEPAGPLTFARALAQKIAEIPPGPHRVGLIDSAVRRAFERSARTAERLLKSPTDREVSNAILALADEVVK